MKFYRVANNETKQGLWYDQNGVFTGLIHNAFSFCQNRDLQMPYDEKCVGYLSATKTLKELYEWFSKDDLFDLKEYGYHIFEYESDDYFYHNNHWLINQQRSRIIKKVTLDPYMYLCMANSIYLYNFDTDKLVGEWKLKPKIA